MGNVVSLRQRRKARVYTSNEQLVEDLVQAIFKSRLTYQAIAQRADVNINTIQRLANGKTAWPKPKTLFGVGVALGLGLQWADLKS